MAAPTTDSESTASAPGACPSSPCSRDIPFDGPTPHAAIDAVIAWLGIGYEATIKRRSDGKKITIRITSENTEGQATAKPLPAPDGSAVSEQP